jgi:hypothetical protein
MGYYIRSISWKKSAPPWKVQFVSYKSTDTEGSNVRKSKREWDIPTDRWQVLGFHRFMTISDAKARAKQLNAQNYLRRQEEKLRKMHLEKWEARKRYEAFLPSEFVAEFESRFIRKRDSQTEQGLRSTVESSYFRRPLTKTMRKHFGHGVTLYAGRKGFSDLMLSKNQSFENISVWMGHSSLQRTWKSYKQRRKFHVAGY